MTRNPRDVRYWSLSALLVTFVSITWTMHRLDDPSYGFPTTSEVALARLAAWMPAGQVWLSKHLGAAIPQWAFVVVLGIFLTSLGLSKFRSRPISTLIVVTGLSGVAESQLGLCIALWIAWGLGRPSRLKPILSFSVSVAWLWFALFFLSIDAGMILFVWLVQWIASNDAPPEQRRTGFLWCALVSILAVGLLGTVAIRSAFFRPFSWISLAPSGQFFSEGAPIWSGTPLSLSQRLMAGALLLLATERLFDGSLARRELPALILFVFVAVGWSCRIYLAPVALLAFLLASDQPAAWPPRNWTSPRAIMAAAVATILLLLGWRGVPKGVLVGAIATEKELKPERWPIDGSVLLTDLSDAAFWQTPERARFRLVLDDRWEVSGPARRRHEQAVADLRGARSETYVQPDGSEGGYLRPMRQWDVALLAVPTSELETLRRLSVNPHWRFAGMDRTRTLFLNSDHDRYQFLAVAASNALRSLEWLRTGSDPTSSEFVVFSGDESRRAIAAALWAMRLPYSALRLLDSLGDSDALRACCYLEIAHRTLRHAGHASLLDEYRAMACLNNGSASVALGLRAARALETLGLLDSAEAIVSNLLRPPWRWMLDHKDRAYSAKLVTNVAANRFANDPNTEVSAMQRSVALEQDGLVQAAANVLARSLRAGAKGEDTSLRAERALRLALRVGDRILAEASLDHLEEPIRGHYRRLLDILDLPCEEAAKRLSQKLMGAAEIDDQRSAEAFYWLGSLYLESGDLAGMASAFDKSEALDSDADYRYLRRMHLSAARAASGN